VPPINVKANVGAAKTQSLEEVCRMSGLLSSPPTLPNEGKTVAPIACLMAALGFAPFLDMHSLLPLSLLGLRLWSPVTCLDFFHFDWTFL
jgi:hypothetical protein